MKRFWMSWAVLAAGMLLLGAACGGGDDDNGGATGSPSPSETAGSDQGTKDTGKATPTKSASKSTPAKNTGKATPTKSASKSTPAKNTGKATPTGDSGALGTGGDEYFAALELIANRTDDTLNALDADYQAKTFASASEEISYTIEYLTQGGSTIEGAMTDVGDLDPPDEAKDEHDAFIQAGADVARLTSKAIEDLAGVTTVDEMNRILDEYRPHIAALNNAFHDKCFALQDLADASLIFIDLRCGPTN